MDLDDKKGMKCPFKDEMLKEGKTIFSPHSQVAAITSPCSYVVLVAIPRFDQALPVCEEDSVARLTSGCPQ